MDHLSVKIINDQIFQHVQMPVREIHRQLEPGSTEISIFIIIIGHWLYFFSSFTVFVEL